MANDLEMQEAFERWATAEGYSTVRNDETGRYFSIRSNAAWHAYRAVLTTHQDYKVPLLGLLARIHRDGGHFTEVYGVKIAAAEADAIVARLNAEIDRAALSRTEATGGEQAPEAGPDVEALQKAYAYGWHRCAEWANREDLHADQGSPAYLRDMAADLGDLAGGEQAVSDVLETTIKKVASALAEYVPAADAYKGKYVHKSWAGQLLAALAASRKGA